MATNGTSNGNGNGKPKSPPPPGPHEDGDGKIPDIDSALRKVFFDVLKETGNKTLAYKAAGISKRTFYRWMQQGERDTEGRYYSFRQAVERGMAAWEQAQVEKIVRAAQDYTAEIDEAEQWTRGDETRSKIVKRKHRKKGDWRAAAWMLERKFPRRYGQKNQVAIEGRLDLVDVLTQLRDEAESERDGDPTPTAGGSAAANGGRGNGRT